MQIPDIIALLVVALVAFSFWKLHRDKTVVFNVFDLIMENGRLSRIACVFIASFLVSSWVMIRIAIDGKMTDSYLLAYGGIFVAPIVAKLFSIPPTPGTTTTITADSSSKTVTRKDAKGADK